MLEFQALKKSKNMNLSKTNISNKLDIFSKELLNSPEKPTIM